jgi:hypothetical protein
MPPVAAIAAGAIIGGGLALGSGLNKAAKARKAGRLQEQAALQAIEDQRAGFAQSQELTAPRRGAETEALNALRGVLGLGGQDFDFDLQNLPGFQFARDEALQATERSAAGRSGAVSGNVLAALQDRAGGVASQFFGQNFLNPLQNLALGGANERAGQNAFALGGNIGLTRQGGAQARASGINRAADAFGQGLGGFNQAIQGGLGNAFTLGGLGIGPFSQLQSGVLASQRAGAGRV